MEVMANRAQGWAAPDVCPSTKLADGAMEGAEGRVWWGVRVATPNTEHVTLGEVRSPPWTPLSASAR